MIFTALSVLASILLGVWIGQKKIEPLALIGEKTTYCEASFSQNPRNLTVYVTDLWLSKTALERLCQDPVVRRQFGNVTMILGSNDFDTYRYISYGIADLALIKDNLVSAFGSDQAYGYRAVAQYPDYQAFFIGKTEKPIITKEYFLGKRIGLLDYPSSRSGHVVPKSQLQKIGINESNSIILYYNSHQELRDKLLVGEVDIIASYWDDNDDQSLSLSYRTEINSDITGSKWYIRGQQRNTDLVCALQNTVTDMSNGHPSSYYHDVQPLLEGCND